MIVVLRNAPLPEILNAGGGQTTYLKSATTGGQVRRVESRRDAHGVGGLHQAVLSEQAESTDRFLEA